jgi:ligand-binding sensor domain-containing protein/DNA-binding CsgD family transcriptional regulator
MRITIRFFHFCILFVQIYSAVAQIKSIGVPNIVNHSRSKYNASTQNWSITQCQKGFLYFGNNDGILEYDGTNWKTYQVPNSSVVRSVLAIGDTIYSGAFEEIGFLAHDKENKLAYHSLNHLIPKPYLNIDEIWNIYESNGKVIFQSFNYIFILNKGCIKIVEPVSKFSMLHQADEDFFIVDVDNGLMLLKDDSLELFSKHPIFFRNEIRCILPLNNGELLIGTSNEGMFLCNKLTKSIKPWISEVNERIQENNLFSAIKLLNGNLAFGSVSNGIYISNQEGHILQHLNRYKGLQNNTILSVFEDRRNNLWLGLDNGIDYLEVSSPISLLNYNYNIESAYTSIVHKGVMYVGTNQGLYAKEFKKINSFNSNKGEFSLIKGTEGQVWCLDIIDNTLFCGHNFGCFIIEGYTAIQISDIRGFWSFLKPANNDQFVLAGTYTGLVRFHRQKGSWDFYDEVKGFYESSRNLFMDSFNNLWVAHGYRGLFKLKLSSSLDSVLTVKLYKAERELPEELPYNIQILNSEMYITSQNGIFKYDHSTDSFKKPDDLNFLFKHKGFIDKIHQDKNGNLWYFTNDYLGLMRLLEDGTYIDITSPFSSVNEILLPAFQNIYIHDSYNVFIGSQKGLIHYSPNIIKDYLVADEVFIKEATFYGKQKSITSFFVSNTFTPSDKTRILPYSKNSVTFKFTSPAFENPDKIEFSHRLVGFNANWSDWDRVNFKEYTNLREGSYTFQIKAINVFRAESEIISFHFVIKPPILRSRAAYAIYLVILILIILGNFYYIRKKILKARQREKLKHEKRLAQREKIFKEQTALSEKEIMQLRNESLKSEMRFKNKELANATLHLIQKNKTLTYLKEDLSKLLKTIKTDSPEKDKVNGLLKKINRDLRNEKSWELFNSYFDEVHQDFIARLKEKYEDLSPKELRLCAYLRMNISTKEIAPLMNISIRGVEISRYRLRKKLKLDHNANLTDFLLSF